MTPADKTARPQTESISFEFDLHHLPQKVWRALTDPVLLAQWLLPVLDLKLEQGAAFTFTTQPQPGWDGTVNCRFLEIEAQRKLSYTWVVGDFIDTVVTFTLTPTPSGTRLSLVQSGFRPDQKQNIRRRALRLEDDGREARRSAREGPVSGKRKRSTVTRSKAPSVRAKPRLLAGDNPQIAKADGDAPVQAYIAAIPGWKRDAARRLDALIERAVPNVRKAVRWNSPFYGVEGQGWFLSYHCFTRYIKVVFLRGTSLRPLPPVESKVPNTRYFHIHEDDQLDEKLVASWIRQASELPGDPLF